MRRFVQVNPCKLRRPLDTVDLEEPPDSRERTGAPVLRLSYEGQIDVWEMFRDNLYLSGILDRQGLLVAAPTHFRTKKAESFSPQLLQGFWSKLKKNNPKIVVMSPTVTAKNSEQKDVIWQQYRLFLAVAAKKSLAASIFFWDEHQARFGTPNEPSCEARTPSGFFIISAISYAHLSEYQPHVNVWFQLNGKSEQFFGDHISKA